ncbi:ribonuclease H-like domain-containing protein [Candidatus Woesearchaeota archaeon]|nr:ribonuclease H-like domain-containing protein [Candidatus Woesearchaeota archaeon]
MHRYARGEGRWTMSNTKEIIFDIETTTLDPLEDDARVICIGVRCNIENRQFITVLAEDSEKRLLENFWSMPVFQGYFRIIGFNCFTFDIPYLLVRSFKHGVKMPDIKGRVTDLRFVLSYGNKFKKGTLDDYAKFFSGNKFKKIKNGEDVAKLWKEKKIDEITTYCGHDVFLTYQIYERLKRMGVV